MQSGPGGLRFVARQRANLRHPHNGPSLLFRTLVVAIDDLEPVDHPPLVPPKPDAEGLRVDLTRSPLRHVEQCLVQVAVSAVLEHAFIRRRNHLSDRPLD